MYALLVLVTVTSAAAAYIPPTAGEDVSLQTLLERIELMESRHATAIEVMETRHATALQSMEYKHADAIQAIESKHAKEIQKLGVKHDKDIWKLTTRVEKCERVTSATVGKVSTTDEATDEETDINKDSTKLSGYGPVQATNQSEHTEKKEKMVSMTKRDSDRIWTPTRRLFEGTNIAFSAYLDHSLTGVGTDQVIVMNQVLLNDGNGYSKHTGAFTAPTDGVYSFSFFIGEQALQQQFIRLTVNSVPQVDAIVDTEIHTGFDAQGGNTVNLKLSAGDAVTLKHAAGYHNSGVLFGSDNSRFTTFSGFLLYTTDSAPIVGK